MSILHLLEIIILAAGIMAGLHSCMNSYEMTKLPEEEFMAYELTNKDALADVAFQIISFYALGKLFAISVF